ncbi:MAG: DHH family phosphoesterase [Candidatus Micrarchaeota archaeon]
MQGTKISEVKDAVECSVSGRVIRTFEARGSFFATLIDESGKIDVASGSPSKVGSLIVATGKAIKRGGALEFVATEVSPLTIGQEETAKQIDAFIERSCRPVEAPMLIQDGVTKSLHHVALECAKRLLTACFLARPVVMRYHGDADGISGALALFRAMKGRRLFSTQNWHTTYEIQDAIRDLNYVRALGESTLGPVAVLVDSGSGEESTDALGLLRGAGFEIIIIDHHPLASSISENTDSILSPMLSGATSYYTAGLLAGEVAKAMGGPDPTELQKISLAGDKSGLIPIDPALAKKALAIDYLGKYSRFQNTLEFYESVLSDEKMLSSVENQASAKLERAVHIARESLKAKELQNGFRLYTANLQKSFKAGEFPGKGMLCGALHDFVSAEMTGPVVTIGYSGRLFSIRANAEARARGFDANAMIGQIRRELINSIETGGGHDVAASLHASEGFENIVLDEIVRNIGSL